MIKARKGTLDSKDPKVYKGRKVRLEILEFILGQMNQLMKM